MPKTKREKFPQRLARVRKAKGLSQYELADLTGISQRMIAHYETKIQNPAPDTVIRLAKALQVSIDELMGYRALKNKEELDRRLVQKAKRMGQLSPKAQKTIMNMIDAFHAERRA